jgi:hypothetical protein
MIKYAKQVMKIPVPILEEDEDLGILNCHK